MLTGLGRSVSEPADGPAQDEGRFLVPSKAYFMLRSARRARLEARTTSMQPFLGQFPDSLESGNSWPLPGRLPWTPAFAGGKGLSGSSDEFYHVQTGRCCAYDEWRD